VTSGDPKPPGSVTPEVPASRGWLGILVVVLGGLTMIGGILGVWLYAKRLPVKPPPTPPVFSVGPTPPGSPPFALPAPTPPPSLLAEPPPPVPKPEGKAPLSLPVAIAPFPQDALAPVPVESGHPLWGGRDAFVTATVFADLECPHSVLLVRELLRLKGKLGDRLRLHYRHRPLSQHAEGLAAARALSEIHLTRGEQAFWQALTAIVRRGEALEPGALPALLGPAGFAGFPLASPLARAEGVLVDDAGLSTRLYVRETPTLFVNGQRAAGEVPPPVLEQLVERERRQAFLLLAAGTPPSDVYGARTRKNLLNLGEDPPQRTCLPLDDAPVIGPDAALVTIVEFSELECDACRQGESALRSVTKAHPSEIRLVWKHFPLPQHQRARLAAGVALAARKLGGDRAFFNVTRALFDQKSNLDDEALSRAATAAGVDADAVLREAKKLVHERRIELDVKAADDLGITGAPTYFINGHRVSGALPESELKQLVERELALARRVRAQTHAGVDELACGALSKR
jgi:protein-disulfide isomerase